jgi:hypothetical protein
MTEPRDIRTSPRIAPLVISLLFAACSPTPTPTPTPAQPPTASPSATIVPTDAGSPGPSSSATGPAAAACATADVKVSHGIVEGTAGSRDTEVILVAAVRCALPAWPALILRDGRGADRADSSVGGSDRIVVQPGGTYATAVQFSNWCAAEPAFPLPLVLVLDGGSVAVTGGPFPEDGDLPPCTGGDVPSLNATAWTATP